MEYLCKMKTTNFWVVILTILSASCTSNDIGNASHVKQSEIYQSYSLTASQEKGTIDVNVFFRFGGKTGTTLRLNDTIGSKIMLNNTPIQVSEDIAGAHYYTSISFTPKENFFKYINSDLNGFENSIICNEFKVYDVPQKLDVKDTLYLSFEGAAPLVTESFIMRYKDTAMNFASDISIKQFIHGNKLIIPASVLKDAYTGEVSLQFVRGNELATKQHGNIPGNMRYTYLGNYFSILFSNSSRKAV